MEIEYGAEVIDRCGQVVGRVDHLVRNTWTGETTKFMVRRRAPDRDLFFSVEDVLEATKSKIKLNVSSNESSETRRER